MPPASPPRLATVISGRDFISSDGKSFLSGGNRRLPLLYKALHHFNDTKDFVFLSLFLSPFHNIYLV